MSVDQALETALSQLGIPTARNLYGGQAVEYITTNYETMPTVFAERAPHAARNIVQVHYHLPHGDNPNSMLQQISEALWEAGFTWPAITNASDADGQHYALECEYVNGGGYYA